jgi:Gluconate 2-dehydrogenase subunit 3
LKLFDIFGQLFKTFIFMQRRNLLKSVAFGIGSLAVLPTWANSWNQNSLTNLGFSTTDDALLGEIVGTILPETATPGAKSLGVHKLIQKIVTDCQGKPAEEKLIANLQKLEDLSKSSQGGSFASLSADKKLTFFKSLENSQDANLKEFYSQMKRMTIDGYMKSEYVMTNITHYEYAPARWNACVRI